VRTSNAAWSLAGLVAGGAGLATSYLTANVMNIRESPVVAVAELVIRHTPGAVAERAIDVLGHNDKPALVVGILVLLAALFLLVGRLARHRWWVAVAVLGLLAGFGAVAVLTRRGSTAADALPVLVGLATWLIVLALLTERLRRIDRLAEDDDTTDELGPDAPRPMLTDEQRHGRRGFLIGAGVIAVLAGAIGVVGRIAGSGRRRVEEARRLLRLAGVSTPAVPADTKVGVDGVTSWMTPADEFYLIDTAVIVPAIEPKDWTLRIHGMVENEVELSYDELVAREITESWVTLNCVSNEVGGDLIGNAWWSGVRLADILAQVGLDPEADAVLQTSDDGWTCGTPLSALTDDRNAMLAVAMNGKPLPIEHGFPVRTLVPGLYGYVSACKWVVDMEVTRFDRISAFWTEKGWGEMGPVKMSSRIDVPRSGDEVPGGEVTFAGMAWSQHTGIDGVEVAVDGGSWEAAELAGVPNDDTWVQWKAVLDVEPGDHMVKVRATDKNGVVQTGAEADVLPDGATGWHSVDFSVQE
jgi:DMSO/TMAO reductase YedYZ molybdopterin-dependent catalytic subunit